MNRFNLFASEFSRILGDFGAARSCAAAVRAGRRPSEAALRRLGLDASLFDRR